MQTRSKTAGTPSSSSTPTAKSRPRSRAASALKNGVSPILKPTVVSPYNVRRKRSQEHINLSPGSSSSSDHSDCPAPIKTNHYPGTNRREMSGEDNGQKVSIPNSNRSPSISAAIIEQDINATSPSVADCSVLSQSLLNAIDEMEKIHIQQPDNVEAGSSSGSDGAGGSNNTNDKADQQDGKNEGSDSWSDDFEMIDMLPASQYQITPTSRKYTAARQHNNSISIDKKTTPKSKKQILKMDQQDKNEAGPSSKGLNSIQFRMAPATIAAAVAVEDKVKTKQNKPNNATTTTKPKKKGGGKGKNRIRGAYTNRAHVKAMSESAGNELSMNELETIPDQDKLLLTSWGLPDSIIRNYGRKGLTAFFEWQLACLTSGNGRVLKGINLVYSAPTSAGKTLVAEILMLKRVLELGKKAIMILPFVSVAREKMISLQELFGDAGVRVEGFMGAYNPPGGFKHVDIAICTIEKANSLINRLLEEKTLSQVGTIVVDELHMIGDSSRGYLLELLLTKIRFMTSQSTDNSQNITSNNNSQPDDGSMHRSKLNIQIIGMSATLPNLNLLANWLDAELYVTDFRPVPLVETIKINDQLFVNEDSLLVPLRQVVSGKIEVSIKDDPDNMVYLSLETVLDGHSVLIFCHTKKWCENTAKKIASEFSRIGHPNSEENKEVGITLRKHIDGIKIRDLLNQLTQCPAKLDPALQQSVKFGVAFHHAGLTFDERDIIESAFKKGILRVIVATSTLSAGVNLPARRVIISSPIMYKDKILDVLTYRQMSGRAGRKGVDEKGESIFICELKNQATAVEIVLAQLPPVKSALLESQGEDTTVTSSMKRAILEVIASEITKSRADVVNYFSCTLISKTDDFDSTLHRDKPASQKDHVDTIKDCLQFLENHDFIRLQQLEKEGNPEEYMPTQLGLACLASSLSPDEGLVVLEELRKAREKFDLASELHVIYQVTPIYLSEQWKSIQWLKYSDILGKLDKDEKRVCDTVGIHEGFIANRIMDRGMSKQTREKLPIYQRFYTALALNDLVKEVPIADVAEKYGVDKGLVQNLQQSASTFAGMVTAFCSRLGWSNLELLLSQFQERLEFGVKRDLCDLMRLKNLNGRTARVLHDGGIKCILDLAAEDPACVEKILHRAGPFNSAKPEEGKSQIIWMLGKAKTETEAAQILVNEARQFLQIELGLGSNVVFGAAPSVAKTASQEPSVPVMQNLLRTLLPQPSPSSSTSFQRKSEIRTITTPITSIMKQQRETFQQNLRDLGIEKELESSSSSDDDDEFSNDTEVKEDDEVVIIDVDSETEEPASHPSTSVSVPLSSVPPTVTDFDSSTDYSSTSGSVRAVTVIDCGSESTTHTAKNSNASNRNGSNPINFKKGENNNIILVNLSEVGINKSSSSSSPKPGPSVKPNVSKIDKSLSTSSWLEDISFNVIENPSYWENDKKTDKLCNSATKNCRNTKSIATSSSTLNKSSKEENSAVKNAEKKPKEMEIMLLEDLNGVFDGSFPLFTPEKVVDDVASNQNLESQTQSQNYVFLINDDDSDKVDEQIMTRAYSSNSKIQINRASSSHAETNGNHIKQNCEHVRCKGGGNHGNPQSKSRGNYDSLKSKCKGNYDSPQSKCKGNYDSLQSKSDNNDKKNNSTKSESKNTCSSSSIRTKSTDSNSRRVTKTDLNKSIQRILEESYDEYKNTSTEFDSSWNNPEVMQALLNDGTFNASKIQNNNNNNNFVSSSSSSTRTKRIDKNPKQVTKTDFNISIQRILEENCDEHINRSAEFETSWNNPDVMQALLNDGTFNNTILPSPQQQKKENHEVSDAFSDSFFENSQELLQINEIEERHYTNNSNNKNNSDQLNKNLYLNSETVDIIESIKVSHHNIVISVMELPVKDKINSDEQNGQSSSNGISTFSSGRAHTNHSLHSSKNRLSTIPELQSSIQENKSRVSKSNEDLFENSDCESLTSENSSEVFENSSVEASPSRPASSSTYASGQSEKKAVDPNSGQNSEHKESQDMFCNDDDDEEKKLPPPHPSSQPLHLVDKIVVVRVIHSLDQLPSNFFKSSQYVSFGIEISSVPKRTAAAVSGKRVKGIGSKIISRSKATAASKDYFVKYHHSIFLYNGGQTMWEFQWEINKPEDDCVATRKVVLSSLFEKMQKSKCPIVLLDSKEKLKKLIKFSENSVIENLSYPHKLVYDPKIAQWLWICEESTVDRSQQLTENLDVGFQTSNLIHKHCSLGEKKVLGINWKQEAKDAFLCWILMNKLESRLKEKMLWEHYIEVEMPTTFPLLMMEMNGFGLNEAELERLKQILQFKVALLELKAFQIANRPFCISSPKDIRQVLFKELGLKQPPKTKGLSKDVLSKMDHELPKIIMEWRKVSSALQKVVIPFQQILSNIAKGRVYGTYSHFTLTGRLVMSEPSIQCVPRDFDLQLSFSISEIQTIKNTCSIRFGSKIDSLLHTIELGIQNQLYEDATRLSVLENAKMNISMRNVFTACSNDYMIVSADYSQLELRILAHFCGDEHLLTALNTDGDVFKRIAAQWKQISIEEVTNDVRQEAKAITYGIIYGMGEKALAGQMEVDDATAAQFRTDFMRTFPKIRSFLDQTSRHCREKEYIETICGRRRYLPNINSKMPHLRAQAERQAVNSKIQGSASDLVKKAMVGIHCRLEQQYGNTRVPVDWTVCELTQKSLPISNLEDNHSTVSGPKKRKVVTNKKSAVPYFPILNLHDELIYEVHKSEIPSVTKVIREVMETSLTLSVKLPVVVKVGETWGTLTPYH